MEGEKRRSLELSKIADTVQHIANKNTKELTDADGEYCLYVFSKLYSVMGLDLNFSVNAYQGICRPHFSLLASTCCFTLAHAISYNEKSPPKWIGTSKKLKKLFSKSVKHQSNETLQAMAKKSISLSTAASLAAKSVPVNGTNKPQEQSYAPDDLAEIKTVFAFVLPDYTPILTYRPADFKLNIAKLKEAFCDVGRRFASYHNVWLSQPHILGEDVPLKVVRLKDRAFGSTQSKDQKKRVQSFRIERFQKKYTSQLLRVSSSLESMLEILGEVINGMDPSKSTAVDWDVVDKYFSSGKSEGNLALVEKNAFTGLKSTVLHSLATHYDLQKKLLKYLTNMKDTSLLEDTSRPQMYRLGAKEKPVKVQRRFMNLIWKWFEADREKFFPVKKHALGDSNL